MNMRNLLAAVLTLFLVTMSCWASACDLSCSLMLLGGGCPMHGVSSPAQRETGRTAQAAHREMSAGMDTAGMAMPDDQSMATTDSDGNPAAHLRAADTCSHGPCAGMGLSVITSHGVDRTPLVHAHAVNVKVPQLVLISERIRVAKPNASPPGLGPVDPLGTTLRF